MGLKIGGGSVARVTALLTVDNSGLKKGLSEAERDVQKSGKNIGKMSHAAGVASAAGFALIAAGLTESVKSAVEWEKVQARMKTSLKDAGISWKQNGDEIEKNIESMAKASGFSKNDLADAFANMVRTTGNVKTAMKDLSLAQDVARTEGISLAASQSMIARVANGSYTSLKKLGIAVTPLTTQYDKLKHQYDVAAASSKKMTVAEKEDWTQKLKSAKAADKQATATEALTTVHKKFGGQSAAYAKTAAGQWDRFRQTIDILEEHIGSELLPKLEKVAAFVSDHMGVVTKLAIAIGAVWAASVLWTASLKAQAIWQAVVTAGTVEGEAAQWSLNAALAANPIGLVVLALAALAAGVIYAYTHFRVFRNVVNGVFDFVKSAVVTTIGFVRNHWQLILAILTGPFGLMIYFIHGHFDTIVNIISGMPGRVKSAASGMWDGIKDAFRGAINWIIGKWNGLSFSMPSVDTHIPGVGKIGGWSLGTPDISPFAAGGRVNRGTPGRDSVPAMLTPGEIVLNRGQQSAVSSVLGMDVGGFLGFAKGGRVPNRANFAQMASSIAGSFGGGDIFTSSAGSFQGLGTTVTHSRKKGAQVHIQQFFTNHDPEPFVAAQRAKFAAQVAFA